MTGTSRGLAHRRAAHWSTFGLVVLTFLATIILAIITTSAGLGGLLSAGLTGVLVLAGSIVYLGASPKRFLASFVGLLMACAPALILATAIMTIAAHLGLPFDLLTARLAAVSGWWVAIAALRPVILRLGGTCVPSWLGALLIVPTVVVAALCTLTWRAGQAGGGTAQRFTFLFRLEDNATWVSHAYAILANGRFPDKLSESAYFSYSPSSSVPGVLADLAVRGRPSPSSAVFAAVDVTMANQLLSIVVAASLMGTALLIALTLIDGPSRVPWVGVSLLSLVVTGAGASLLAATPLLTAGHLSLAWANVGLVLTGLATVLALRARSWGAFAWPFVCACLAVYEAAGSWAFLLLTPVIFALLLISFRRSGLRTPPARPVGAKGQVLVLAAGLFVAATGAGALQFIRSISVVGLTELASAAGGITPVEPTTLAMACLLALGAAVVAYRREDSFTLMATLLFASAGASACLVFASQVIPGNDPTYSLTKSLQVLVALSPLSLVGLVAVGALSRYGRLVIVVTLVAMAMITTSPSFGSVLRWWGTVDGQSSAVGQQFLRLTSEGVRSDDHVLCQPSPYVPPIDNYMCNRWADAVSHRQGTTAAWRIEVLAEGGAAPAAWAAASARGYLAHATIVNAGELKNGSCIPEANLQPDGSASLTARSVPVPTSKSAVGSLDTVQQCSRTLVVSGWAPFTGNKELLSVWADGPVKVIKSIRVERPDVVTATGDSSLTAPGFLLVLRQQRGLASHLCLGFDGRRLVGSSKNCG